MSKKIIAWENWSEIEKELVDDTFIVEDSNASNDEEDIVLKSEFIMGPLLPDMRSPIIQTPFGNVSSDSKLKPSDRWDCWLGYTNFGITEDVQVKMQEVEGVDALKVMSRYSFCVGIGKLFKFSQVRKEIENAICRRNI